MISRCERMSMLKPITEDSVGYVMRSTTSFSADTNPVSRLSGIAAWKRVDHRAREGFQLQGGIRRKFWLRKPLKKLYMLGTYMTKASVKNLGSLEKELPSF